MTLAGRGLRLLELPFKVAILGFLSLYRLTVSPLLGLRCRFFPSCSAYAEEAIRVHGVLKGAALAAWRVLRCQPLSGGGPDPVPARGTWRRATAGPLDEVHDNVIRRVV
jgi:hypothetical protein